MDLKLIIESLISDDISNLRKIKNSYFFDNKLFNYLNHELILLSETKFNDIEINFFEMKSLKETCYYFSVFKTKDNRYFILFYSVTNYDYHYFVILKNKLIPLEEKNVNDFKFTNFEKFFLKKMFNFCVSHFEDDLKKFRFKRLFSCRKENSLDNIKFLF